MDQTEVRLADIGSRLTGAMLVRNDGSVVVAVSWSCESRRDEVVAHAMTHAAQGPAWYGCGPGLCDRWPLE